GEATLAAWLKAPAEPATLRARQDAIVELAPRTDLREDLAVLGEDARTGVHAEVLAEWSEQPARLDPPSPPAGAGALSVAVALALMGLLIWAAALLDVLPVAERTLAALRLFIVTMFAICGGITWRFRARSVRIFHDADEAAHDLGLLAGVPGRLEAERF